MTHLTRTGRMQAKTILRYSAWAAFAVALGMGVHLANESKATSYLSESPEACINCHVMEAYHASWAHSSHAQHTVCVDCHLPVDNYVDKYASKARDGFNHSLAFTTNSYGKRLIITQDGARRVQENCIRCHTSLATPVGGGVDHLQLVAQSSLSERKCWDCHRMVPHGRVRSIYAAPNNLGVRWNREQ